MRDSKIRRLVLEEVGALLGEGTSAGIDPDKYGEDPLYAAYLGSSDTIELKPKSRPGKDDAGSEIAVSEKDREQVIKKLKSSGITTEDAIDLALDLLGWVGGLAAGAAAAGSMGLGAPLAYVIAAVPDLINSYRHAARGKSIEAGIYFLSALPILGEVLGPVKISQKIFSTAAKADKVFKLIQQVRSLINAAKATHNIDTHYDKIIKFLRKRLPADIVSVMEKGASTVMNGSDQDVIDLMENEGYRVVQPTSPADVSEAAQKKPPAKKKTSAKKKELDKLPPIPTTAEFDSEMRSIISAHSLGADIEGWLMSDLFGSDEDDDYVVRKTGFKGDEDFYRKGSASYIAQHLAAHRDPELRGIGQRVLGAMKRRIGGHTFSGMGGGLGLDPKVDR